MNARLTPRKTPDQWLAEYSVCHQHPVNKMIHCVCVPAIVASLVGILWAAPFPWPLAPAWLNWALVVIIPSLIFYGRLSPALAIGMAIGATAIVGLIMLYEWAADHSVAMPAAILFGVAWIGQFIGHKIEGRRPAFWQDVQFLLIGPLWVLDTLYRRLGLKR